MTSLQPAKLCPTFTVLTQVALQLAKIVGIFDARSDSHEKSEEYRQYIDQQQAAFGFDYGPQPTHGGHGHGNQNGNVVHNWFQKDPVELPWDLKDFFGTEGYVASGPIVSESYGGHLPNLGGVYAGMGMLGEEEDLMAPVPPHTAYTHWGTIDTPFARSGMGGHGGLPKGPGMH